MMGVVIVIIVQPPLAMIIDLRDSGRHVHRRANVLNFHFTLSVVAFRDVPLLRLTNPAKNKKNQNKCRVTFRQIMTKMFHIISLNLVQMLVILLGVR